jgi:hypothetical protein
MSALKAASHFSTYIPNFIGSSRQFGFFCPLVPGKTRSVVSLSGSETLSCLPIEKAQSVEYNTPCEYKSKAI